MIEIDRENMNSSKEIVNYPSGDIWQPVVWNAHARREI